MVELIGYVGSALIVLSLTMTSVLRLRVINLVGAVVFTVYGLLIDAPPVWAVNAAIVGIDVWAIAGLLRPSRSAAGEVLEVGPDDPYLRHVLEASAEDIARFVPGFDGVRPDHRALLVLRDLAPAAVVLARPLPDGTAHVDLDHAPPAFRDLASGRLLYEEGHLYDALGVDVLTAGAGTEAHTRYLRRLGFEPTDAPGLLRRRR
ncbi:MAG: hypothetical protein ACLGIR_13920 [Actinomycetes bacterium]